MNDTNTTSNEPQFPAPQPEKVAVAAQPANWERTALEKLATNYMAEQRTARRWRTFVRLAWLTFFALIAWSILDRGAPSKDFSVEHTAVIEIKGEIASGGETSADQIVTSLRSAFEDKGAKAVVLLINSPGGSPVQAGMINDEIYRLKALHKNQFTLWWKKPVPQPRTTSLWLRTKFMWTKPVSSAALAC